jgi:hypothetical protein
MTEKIAIFERGMGPIPDARSVFRQLRRVQLAKGADGSQNWARIGPIWGMPVYYNRLDKGGHFAAWEQPEIFAAEPRAAFRSLR